MNTPQKPQKPQRGLRADSRTDLNGLQQAWLGIAGAFEHLGAVPLIAGLLAAVAYLMLGTRQGPDLTHTVVQDGVGTPYFFQQVFMLSLASLWLGGQAWFWSRRMVSDACGDNRKNWTPKWLLDWLPRVLGVTPFAIATGAFLLNQEDAWATAAVLAVLGVAFLILLWLRLLLLAHTPKRITQRLVNLPELFIRGSWLFAGLTLAWVCFDPVRPAQFVGAIGVVYFGVGMVISVACSLIHWGRYWRLPVMAAMVLWAVALTGLSHWTGDNHAVGRRAFGGGSDVGPPSTVQRPTFDQAFDAWYAGAPFGPDHETKPMIVVAAAGGASRAGFWAAEVLGRLQEDSGGRFSDSVFALSSVSGGSVGAAAFVSQVRDKPIPLRKFRTAVREAAGGDYLSPALAGVLYPDLAQRFLPTLRLGGKEWALPDRAEGLEKAFERGWADHCAKLGCDADLWGKPFLKLWNDPSRPTPLWFVNGARQEDGRRILTSLVQIDPKIFPDAADFFVVTGGRDLAVSSAIHNGARFPLVSPGGTLLDKDGHAQGHVLDGGYFENSGVTTAGDIIRAAKALANDPAHPGKYKIRPILIELNNDSDTASTDPGFVRGWTPMLPAQLTASQTHYFLSDILGPLGGITASNDGRARPVALAVSREIGQDYVLVHLCNVDKAGKPSNRHAPMDWVLSEAAKQAMTWADRLDKRDACGNRIGLRRVLEALPARAPAPAGAAAAPAANGK
jgi:hypothetical protein